MSVHGGMDYKARMAEVSRYLYGWIELNLYDLPMSDWSWNFAYIGVMEAKTRQLTGKYFTQICVLNFSIFFNCLFGLDILLSFDGYGFLLNCFMLNHILINYVILCSACFYTWTSLQNDEPTQDSKYVQWLRFVLKRMDVWD